MFVLSLKPEGDGLAGESQRVLCSVRALAACLAGVPRPWEPSI